MATCRIEEVDWERRCTKRRSRDKWFGGKADSAEIVWSALGDPVHYCEPFAGSLAVLLRRPHLCNRTYYSETVADTDSLLCNFWRAVQLYPQETAEAASWPVSELDKHARGCHVLKWRETEACARLAGDPFYCDPLIAGWWAWCVCVSIGAWGQGGPWWPDADGILRKRPKKRNDEGEPGVKGDRPDLVCGRGVNRPQAREPGVSADLPHLGNDGKGVNHARTREPGVGIDYRDLIARDYEATGGYHPMTMPEIRRWFDFLSARLRHVRIINGDWTGAVNGGWQRAVTTGAAKTLPVRQKKGPCGIFCMHPDTPIRLEDESHVAVSEVCRGMLLHGGRTIKAVWSRVHSGPILRLKLHGMPDDLVVTPEHRVLRIPGRPNGTRQDVRTSGDRWALREIVRADEISVGDIMLVPLGGKEKAFRWEWDSYVKSRKARRQKDVRFNPTDGIWRLLGYYAAEGCIHWRYGRPGTVQFTFSRNERDTHVKDTMDLCSEIFGITPTVRLHNPGAINLHLGSVPVAEFFSKYVPGNALTKRLHPSLLTASMKAQEQILVGWMRGDGGISHGSRNRAKLTGTSSSDRLARDMVTLALRCGLRPSFKRRVNGNGFTTNDVYFASKDAQRLGWHVAGVKDRCSRRIVSGHMLIHVRAVTVEQYSGPVYDVDVDHDDLLVAAGVLIHNCDPPYGVEDRDSLYGEQESFTVATKVREWCLANGDDPDYRIVYAGFDQEGKDLVAAGWREVEWFRAGHLKGGMGNVAGTDEDGNVGHQQHRERLWLSPNCLAADEPAKERGLFDE